MPQRSAVRARAALRLLDEVTPRRLAGARTAAGVLMLARPRTVTDLLGADPATSARTTWLVRMLGAREVGLGAGLLIAARRDPGGLGTWIAAGLVSDATDMLVLPAAVAAGHLGAGRGRTLLVAGAAAGAVLSVVQQAAALRRR